MAYDKLFQRRKALNPRALERCPATRSPRERALIVCEDAVSAPAYFKKLITDLGINTVDVKICGSDKNASAPISVVNFGANHLKQDGDFDYVFFVFDKDNHDSYNQALAKIKGLEKRKEYKKKTIQATTSVPCFELWLLLHYESSSKPYASCGNKSPAKCLIADLKKLKPFINYEKGSCSYFDLIKNHLDTAIKNAESLLKAGQDTGQNSHHINPSTLIHELVKVLKHIADS